MDLFNKKCKYCYLNCCKLGGYNNHECQYFHKCKEHCSICLKCKCIKKECENMCLIIY